MAARKTQEGKDKFKVLVDNTYFLVTFKGTRIHGWCFEKITKQKPDAQFPRMISNWILKGCEVIVTPKELVRYLNRKFMPIKTRSTNWRILNRTFKLGTHSSENYWYQECKVCLQPIVGVEHSSQFWKKAQWELQGQRLRNMQPGKDVFFHHTMGDTPMHLKALFYHCALHRIHVVRRSKILDQKPINVTLMIHQWKLEVKHHLERIHKFGQLIPGKF
ncbi:hypothetical protein DSO57_1028678 [Entomophthora muscae]|uniref:Uncharacterized protein n=1 Tax=Entomophthora muscae TaxID=34485 RepID=A0ACC2RSF1_9FUNG|nr:hypothetical protein DSO57_1028678 [Entomophthora muscae]